MTEYGPVDCHRVCWDCKFNQHPAVSHGWPDADDRELLELRGKPPEEVETYMAMPCLCTCNPDMGR